MPGPRLNPPSGAYAIALALAFAIGLAVGPLVQHAGAQGGVGQQAPASPSSAPLAREAYVGRLVAQPAKGPIGSQAKLQGSGFDPNAELRVVWQTFHGAWKVDVSSPENYKGRQYAEELVPLGTVRTDANGAFSLSFTVPDGFGFAHDIRVLQGDVVRNQTSFYVEMQVTFTPTSGPVGTPITVDARGIGVNALHSSWLLTYDNKFTGWISSVTTDGHARFTVPATGAVGPHVLKILHGSFTFPYMNMQQSPDPTRPTFTQLFQITPGAPVLPKPMDQQALPSVAGTPTTGSGVQLWTDPAEGPVGTSLVVHGSGLSAGAELAATWLTQVGIDTQMIGGSGEARPDAEWKLGTARVAADGTLAWSVKVPADKGGAHQIVLRDGSTTVGSTSFVVHPTAQPITPQRGPVGTTITLDINGMIDTDTGKILMLVYDNALVGYSCSVTSQGKITIFLPAAGEPGWHYIDLYPGIYKGDDLPGVYNYRLPQLTYAEDHPGERMPAFHYAFEVTPGS